MKTLKHICPRSVGSLVADLGLNFRTVKNQTNKNSAYDYSVIFLPTACAGGCRLRCLTANFCEWSRLGRHCGSLESQHDVQECHCPTLLAVAMKGLCAHCGQGITVFKQRQKYGYYEIKWLGTSLVVQWLRLWAPTAGAQAQSLVRELDPTCYN